MRSRQSSRSASSATPIRHQAVVVALCTVGLAGSYAVAAQDPVPAWELRVTERMNDVPDAVATSLYPIMQLGTLAGPALVAAAIYVRTRDRWLTALTVVAGVVTWLGAKAIKQLVQRDRPRSFLPEIVVREGDGAGLGYVSGHSAVAATAAVMALVLVPPRWRWIPVTMAGLVGVARIVHGVHLPADVIGGWSFGTLVAMGALHIHHSATAVRTSS